MTNPNKPFIITLTKEPNGYRFYSLDETINKSKKAKPVAVKAANPKVSQRLINEIK
jgi:hypothetical protein